MTTAEIPGKDMCREQGRKALREVEYYYCPTCGFRMSDAELMSIIVAVPCPGRGGKPCFHCCIA